MRVRGTERAGAVQPPPLESLAAEPDARSRGMDGADFHQKGGDPHVQ